MTTWDKIQDSDEYTDYWHCVPDVNGYGVRLQLTLNREKKTAYMLVTVDHESGDYAAESNDIQIPWSVALAMADTTETALLGAPDV